MQPISDALVFHLPVTNVYDLPESHPPWQSWMVNTAESPLSTQPWLGQREDLDGKINLTLT